MKKLFYFENINIKCEMLPFQKQALLFQHLLEQNLVQIISHGDTDLWRIL